MYENHLNILLQGGHIEYVDNDAMQGAKTGIFILRDMQIYDKAFGLLLDPQTGNGIYI